MEFDRFDDQCKDCSCYIDNIGTGEVFDPDCDCTLGHETYGDTECLDCDKD